MRRRVVLGLCTVNMLWLQVVYSQRLYTSFGPVAERQLPFTPAGLALRQHPGRRAEIAVLSQSPPGIHLFTLDDAGGVRPSGSTALGEELDGLVAGDGAGAPAFCSLTPDGTSAVLIAEARGTFVETVFPLGVRSQRIALADIDGDGRKDILLFGKNRAGVSTLLARGNGTYVPGPDLFPDISVSDLRTADINGDGIPDVIVCDWLSNRLVLFYGIGRLVFSEQVTTDLPGEPDALAWTWLEKRRTLGIAVAAPAQRKILFLRATPSGDVQLEAVMQVPGHVRALEFVPLNDHPFPDIVASADEGTIVSAGEGPFTFSPPALIGPGAFPAGWALGDIDGDGRVDLAVAEKSSRRLVLLANAGRGGATAWQPTYAAGSRPRGVIAADLDGDGLADIAVANAGSSSVTLLFNRGEGRFSGGATALVGERPSSLSFTPRLGAVPGAIVTSHTASDMLGVLTAADFPRTASFIGIPTGARPHVLESRLDSASLRIILRYRGEERNAVSLSVFEQIGGGQFLERSMRFGQGERIAAATMESSGNGGAYAVAFVTTSPGRGTSTLHCAAVTSSFTVGKITPVLTFADSSAAVSGVLPVTLRQGGGRDYIVVLGKPVYALLLAYRLPDGTFRSEPEWIRNVSVTGDDDVVIADVDGDGRPDITVRDEASASIVTYYGGALGFGAGVRVAGAKDVGGFAVAHLLSGRALDLVVTHEGDGTVSIIPDPFRRRP